MKEFRMITMCLLAMMATNLSVKAQEVTITLDPGWTWISYPSTDTLDFATALGSFTPMTGDRITSQWGFAVYSSGQWHGNISQFYPGYGYHYKSNRTEPATVTFNAQQPNPQSNTPIGALNGKFTINANGDQVYFSQGNLQYQASTNTWRFAENQWNYIGYANSNISPTYDGWIDLLGWGTSGFDHGAVCYQPWSTSENYSDYYAYGLSNTNLYDQTGQADWGYNVISNGGNQENLWRTLTMQEWHYLIKTRNTPSGIRWAVAKVNNKNGIIILPDDWSSSIYTFSNVNGGWSYSNNIINATEWIDLFQANGAVFLPAAGSRYMTSVGDIAGGYGNYYSTTYYSDGMVYILHFDAGETETQTFSPRYNGFSVRLVRDAE